MAPPEWSHNIHYYGVILNAVRLGCRRALDAGCGRGLLVRKLALRCGRVTAMDRDRPTLQAAEAGDVITYAFGSARFDFISAVATLHHLPMRPALKRFRDLLQPEGVLAIVGLYRAGTLMDHTWNAVALPVSRAFKSTHRIASVTAPPQEPRETLGEIRSACLDILPGAASAAAVIQIFFGAAKATELKIPMQAWLTS